MLLYDSFISPVCLPQNTLSPTCRQHTTAKHAARHVPCIMQKHLQVRRLASPTQKQLPIHFPSFPRLTKKQRCLGSDNLKTGSKWKTPNRPQQAWSMLARPFIVIH
jgi:hypothetical protein